MVVMWKVAHFDLDSPGAYSWATYGPVDPVTGYEAAILPSALACYAAHHPRLFFVTGRIPDQSAAVRAQKAVLWLNQHYHLLRQCVTRTVVVRLYQTE